MPRIPTSKGFKFESENRKLYIGVNTDVYIIHIGIGRFSFSIDRKIKPPQSKSVA